MADFRYRSADPEAMDDLTCHGDVVTDTLRELETVNKFLGGNNVTLKGLESLIHAGKNHEPVLVADLGCGSGEMLRLMRKWSLRSGVNVSLLGIDANPFIIQYAINHTGEHLQVRFETDDIFSDSFRSRRFDIVTGTLFFHHFSNDQLIDFFSRLRKQVRIGLIINDIHRHRIAYYSIKWLTRLFSRSPMVKYDAPLSVLRAFRRDELKGILQQAGFTDYTIRWMWAFRWQVVARTG